jgi:hypothetical protein
VRRLLLLVLTALTLLGSAPSGAFAAGTGGIEITPDPGSGPQQTAFHVKVPSRGSVTVGFFLRNLTAKRVTGRLYATSAARDGAGHFTVGEAGSAKGVSLKDSAVTLAPHEVRHETFRVSGKVSGTQYRAIVIEVQHGAITERAATVVYLSPGRRVPVPVVLGGIAALLVLVAGVALVVTRRRAARSAAGPS